MAEGDVNYEANRENLLDVVLDRLAKAGKATIFARVIVVARFAKREANEESLKGQRVSQASMHATTCPSKLPTSLQHASTLPFLHFLHETAFHHKIISKHDQHGEVTGMLLSYPACMIQMLEVMIVRAAMLHTV